MSVNKPLRPDGWLNRDTLLQVHDGRGCRWQPERRERHDSLRSEQHKNTSPCFRWSGPETRTCRCCLPRQAEAAHRKLTLLCVCIVCGWGWGNDEWTGSWCYSLQDCNYFWVYKEGQLLGRCCTKTSFNAGAGTSCTPKMIAGVCGRKPKQMFSPRRAQE